MLQTLTKLFYKQELFLSNSGTYLINEKMNDISNMKKAYIHKDAAGNIIDNETGYVKCTNEGIEIMYF